MHREVTESGQFIEPTPVLSFGYDSKVRATRVQVGEEMLLVPDDLKHQGNISYLLTAIKDESKRWNVKNIFDELFKAVGYAARIHELKEEPIIKEFQDLLQFQREQRRDLIQNGVISESEE